MGSEWQMTQYGSMSARLHKATLENLCIPGVGIQTGPFGSQLHKKDYVATGTPIITVEHLGDNRITRQNLPCVSHEDKSRLSKYTLEAGDIVFSRVGSVDRRSIVRSEENGWLFSGRCLRVRVDKAKINPDFLSWFFGFEGFKKHIRRIAVGATMPSLNTKILSQIPIYFPSLSNQRAIAHILGSLDDKIELNRQMNRTLEKMAQAIFKSWFIDFDPVRAKSESRDPGLPKEIADLFPDSFEESELGEIPKGWEVKTLSSIIELIGGGTPKSKIAEYWNGDIPWFSVVDAPNESDIWVIDTEKHVTQTGVENSSTKILPIKTTIISARGTVGKCALVGRPMAMNQSCYGIRPADGFGEICTNFTVRNQIMALQRSGHGSVFNTITRATFDSIRIADGGCEISTAFDKFVDSYVSAILENLHEASLLTRLRDTLLPQLISGKLPIQEIEKFVGGEL